MQVNTDVVATKSAEVEKLVSRSVNGDFEAFGELYGVYMERIYRYVFYQVRDKMMAEDITEEVFIKAWKAIKSCKGREATFSPWLYRIAHNHIIDTYRKRQQHITEEMENSPDTRDTAHEVEIILEQEQLLEMISGLPEQQRQVTILKFVEGMDNCEIEQIMGKHQGAIRALQMRALATLRRQLSGEV